MHIALGHDDGRMAKNITDLGQRDASLHEPSSASVTKVMGAEIFDPSLPAC